MTQAEIETKKHRHRMERRKCKNTSVLNTCKMCCVNDHTLITLRQIKHDIALHDLYS